MNLDLDLDLDLHMDMVTGATRHPVRVRACRILCEARLISIMLNLVPNRINSFGKLKCTQRPHATPPLLRPFCGCLAASLACTHNFSSAPRLSLPTSFVNCTHLTRARTPPYPPSPPYFLPPSLVAVAVHIIFAQFPTLFSNLRASSASSSAFARKKSLHNSLTVPPLALSCHAPLCCVLSQCAISEKIKKENARNC